LARQQRAVGRHFWRGFGSARGCHTRPHSLYLQAVSKPIAQTHLAQSKTRSISFHPSPPSLQQKAQERWFRQFRGNGISREITGAFGPEPDTAGARR